MKILTSAFSQLVLEVDARCELLAFPAASLLCICLLPGKTPAAESPISAAVLLRQHTGTTGGEPHPCTARYSHASSSTSTFSD